MKISRARRELGFLYRSLLGILIAALLALVVVAFPVWISSILDRTINPAPSLWVVLLVFYLGFFLLWKISISAYRASFYALLVATIYLEGSLSGWW